MQISGGTLLAGSDVSNGNYSFRQSPFDYASITPVTLSANNYYVITGASGRVDPYDSRPTTFSTDSRISSVEDLYSNNGGTTASFPTTSQLNTVGYFGGILDIQGADPAGFSGSAAPEPSQVGMMALIGLGGLILRAKKRSRGV